MKRWIALWWPAVLLGLATIGSYGTVQYSIGVLIPAIHSESGWSTAALSAGFSLATLGQGFVALMSGRLLDSRGSRPVLLPALAAGAALLLLASIAKEAWQFVVCWGVGGAAIGGGLFYNVTMPVTARLYRDRRVTAFQVLTLLGALASPIFYPVAGLMIDAWGWRGALRGLLGLTAMCVAPAALFVRSQPSPSSAATGGSAEVRRALRQPVVWRALLMFGLAAMANSALLLHQVAAMRAAGLSLAAASGYAGARGAFQIPGRLVLTPLTSKLGVRGALALCYGAASTATLALLLAVFGADAEVLALFFAVAGGVSLGLLSPLNGLLQVEAFGEARLGTLSGVAVIVTSSSGAAGALVMGLARDATGSYRLPLAAVILVQGLAIAALAWQRRATLAQPAQPASEEVAG
jgi:MFS family permease